MNVTYWNVLLRAHLRQQIQKVTHRKSFTGAGLEPDGDVAGMIAAEYACKVAGQFFDLGVADIGIKDLFKDGHLFGSDELFIVQETAIKDDG